MSEEISIKPTKRKRIKYTYANKYYSAYAHYRIKKKFPEITRNQCAQAISLYFQYAADDLSTGTKISFLNKLGAIYLSKQKREVTYNPETNKIINYLPVNIYESLKLWKARPDLYNKTFVRYTNDHSDGFVYRFHYEHSKAIYKNKNIYDFKINRTLKHRLRDNIYDKKVDAYLIPQKTKHE